MGSSGIITSSLCSLTSLLLISLFDLGCCCLYPFDDDCDDDEEVPLEELYELLCTPFLLLLHLFDNSIIKSFLSLMKDGSVLVALYVLPLNEIASVNCIASFSTLLLLLSLLFLWFDEFIIGCFLGGDGSVDDDDDDTVESIVALVPILLCSTNTSC